MCFFYFFFIFYLRCVLLLLAFSLLCLYFSFLAERLLNDSAQRRCFGGYDWQKQKQKQKKKQKKQKNWKHWLLSSCLLCCCVIVLFLFLVLVFIPQSSDIMSVLSICTYMPVWMYRCMYVRTDKNKFVVIVYVNVEYMIVQHERIFPPPSRPSHKLLSSLSITSLHHFCFYFVCSRVSEICDDELYVGDFFCFYCFFFFLLFLQ